MSNPCPGSLSQPVAYESTEVRDMDITEFRGALHVVFTAAAAAMVALAIAQFFPTIVPARAGAVRL